ncbi:DUF1768-domain-containing protein [Pluteus cervinus]|uniref:DUF1768-domain-containing protein n=1 Tax=Pluteus cervinus TaxID=181527 RepID=A0ACD3AQJ1_9AGAR|nr:DUF1768-domain-containing protein [Pluteus cervinus]
MRSKDDFVFFWKTNEDHGWGSQWGYSPFTATIQLGGKEESVKFLTAEHWMMIQKALLFQDEGIAKEILEVTGTSSQDMAYVKSLGRKVKGFDEDQWVAERDRIVLEGSLHKFRQSPELKAKLLATGDKEIVEASPRDRIWGIGYGENSALSRDRSTWGLNLLGMALVETRKILREEGESL